MNRDNNNNTDQPSIEKLLAAYSSALNASDIAQITALFTVDGIIYPDKNPAASGQEQLIANYELVLMGAQIKIESFVDEIVISGAYAFARTHAKGTALIRATNQSIPVANRGIFVLLKEAGEWKISRHIFNQLG